MRIAFRADASLEIGTGHIVRCLALANILRERGVQSNFICRSGVGALQELIVEQGHSVWALPLNSSEAIGEWHKLNWYVDAQQTLQVISDKIGLQKLDWIVVDHYALDHRWEKEIHCGTKRIMVIDDLANRGHQCDLLLDQNLGRNTSHYLKWIGTETKALIGPHYALLRSEFAELRDYSLSRRKEQDIRRLLISMGGVDKNNVTGEVLDALRRSSLPEGLSISVVMGSHAPWLQHVKKQAKKMPRSTEVLTGVKDMAQLMSDSDLAIGAAGGTAWERCVLGVPSFVMVLARNQEEGAVALQNHGAAILLRSSQQLTKKLEILQSEKTAQMSIKSLSLSAAAVTDGLGCMRVVEHMLGINV